MMRCSFSQSMPAKNPRLTVVIPPKLKKMFERLCELEHRSMSNMMVSLAQEAVDRAIAEGRLKVDDLVAMEEEDPK
ncbi:MAG: hypothetical protein SW833_11285 [Cyanobacteriota bacterium]|nr:hypothetical protein [Cyanobacteriota bacterium]